MQLNLSLIITKNFPYRKILKLDSITEGYLCNTLKSVEVRKAAGIDQILGKFLKDGARILAKPISELCNLSMALGSFLDACKIAKVKPLFKKGSKTDPSNYRRISLLPLLSKVFERVALDQTEEFLSLNKILYDYQSGFRKNHSTDTCLSFLNDKILKGFDDGLVTGMILIDLQKAFDTINHDILLKKLSIIGFSDHTVKWFQSYLSNRKFMVNLENSFSEVSSISCGVPQGSILGPLLFLIYVNDMPMAVKCDLFLYADDTCLVFQSKNVKDIKKQLNEDFANICDWFVDNKLSIHFGEDKTKSILFASKRKMKNLQKLEIIYNNNRIKQHSGVTYLGCILEETMSGESMANKLISKVNARSKFLHCKNKYLTPNLRHLPCNALIQPQFDYVCSLWYPNLSKKLKNRIQALQNKCIRFCLQVSKMLHISEKEFEIINCLHIKERYNQCVNSIAFKYFHNQCPHCLNEVFMRAPESRSSLRNSYKKLQQFFCKINTGQKVLSFIDPALWNKVPEKIKRTTNLNAFKSNLNKHYLKKLGKENF